VKLWWHDRAGEFMRIQQQELDRCVHDVQAAIKPTSCIGHGWPLIRRNGIAARWALSGAGVCHQSLSVAKALELLNQKDAAGHRLMMQMCKPRKPRKERTRTRFIGSTTRSGWRLGEYCIQDVEVGQARACVPPLSPGRSSGSWTRRLTAGITPTGCSRQRLKIAQAAAPEINAELAEITEGAVSTSANHQAHRLARSGNAFADTLDKRAVSS
jgi:hypothetical protein